MVRESPSAIKSLSTPRGTVPCFRSRRWPSCSALVWPRQNRPPIPPTGRRPSPSTCKNIRQVTSDDAFVRAGEGYFSPDGKTIIFQAEEKGTAIRSTRSSRWTWPRASSAASAPAIGKTTCSFFRPDGKKIIFASTHLDPDAKKHYAAEIQKREEEKKTGRRAATPGTSTRTSTSSRPTPTAAA